MYDHVTYVYDDVTYVYDDVTHTHTLEYYALRTATKMTPKHDGVTRLI